MLWNFLSIPYYFVFFLPIAAIVVGIRFGILHWILIAIALDQLYTTLRVRKFPEEFRRKGWNDLAIKLWRFAGFIAFPIWLIWALIATRIHV